MLAEKQNKNAVSTMLLNPKFEYITPRMLLDIKTEKYVTALLSPITLPFSFFPAIFNFVIILFTAM